MASLLLIDNNVQQDLKSLAEHAYNNEYSIDDMLDRRNGAIGSPGDDENFYRNIPVGYKVVFTVENAPNFKARHMSISGPQGKIPHPVVIDEILEMLGFDNRVMDEAADKEEFNVSTYEQNCINVIELIQQD